MKTFFTYLQLTFAIAIVFLAATLCGYAVIVLDNTLQAVVMGALAFGAAKFMAKPAYEEMIANHKENHSNA